MFRCLIMAIFRLYMKYLLSSYTNLPGLFIWSREGVQWARDLVSVIKVRRVHTVYINYFIEHNGDDEPHDVQ